MEGLSRILKKAHSNGDFRGISVSQDLAITHLLFVDDILIFYDGSRRDIQKLSQGLKLFKRAFGMVINEDKSTINWENLEDPERYSLGDFFNFQCWSLDDGVKYLGFFLKPKEYRKTDWSLAFSKD